jgi:hypothetical protein
LFTSSWKRRTFIILILQYLTSSIYSKMDSKYCSGCIRKLPLSCFPTNASGKVLATCTSRRSAQAKSNKKRKALQELDPNLPSKRRATRPGRATTTPGMLKPRPIDPSPLESRPTPPRAPESCGSHRIRSHSPRGIGTTPRSCSSSSTTTYCTIRKWLPLSRTMGVDTDLQ